MKNSNDGKMLIFLAISVVGLVIFVHQLMSLLTVTNYMMQPDKFVLGMGLLGIGTGSLLLNENTKNAMINLIGFSGVVTGIILFIWSFFLI